MSGHVAAMCYSYQYCIKLTIKFVIFFFGAENFHEYVQFMMVCNIKIFFNVAH